MDLHIPPPPFQNPLRFTSLASDAFLVVLASFRAISASRKAGSSATSGCNGAPLRRARHEMGRRRLLIPQYSVNGELVAMTAVVDMRLEMLLQRLKFHIKWLHVQSWEILLTTITWGSIVVSLGLRANYARAGMYRTSICTISPRESIRRCYYIPKTPQTSQEAKLYYNATSTSFPELPSPAITSRLKHQHHKNLASKRRKSPLPKQIIRILKEQPCHTEESHQRIAQTAAGERSSAISNCQAAHSAATQGWNVKVTATNWT